MVVGEGRNYLAALIVPDREALQKALAETQADGAGEGGAILASSKAEDAKDAKAAVDALYRHRIDACLRGVSRHEQIARFVLLDRAFCLEEGELTPKNSLRREVIAEHFAEPIEALFRPCG